MQKISAGLLAVCLMFLSACTEEAMQLAASGGSSAGKTAEERKLESEARALNQVTRDIIVRNTLEGAAIGAAAGCGIALLIGGDAEDCARGMVAGGVVGGIGGNAVGQQAAAKNEEIVKTAEVVKNLSQVSGRLNGVESRLRSVLRSQNAEIRSLRRQVAAGQVSESALNSRVRAINSNRSNVRASLQRTQNNISEARQEIASARQQGQTGLGRIDAAASSTGSRVSRTLRSISLIDA